VLLVVVVTTFGMSACDKDYSIGHLNYTTYT